MARPATLTIAVYADWKGLPAPLRLGLLHARRGARHEVFEFAFDRTALAHPSLANLHLDARLRSRVVAGYRCRKALRADSRIPITHFWCSASTVRRPAGACISHRR